MKTITLPSPIMSGGMPLLDAIAARRSMRNYDATRELDLQTLSNLLWAAWGFSAEKRRTAPSSHNRQETSLYLAMRDGVYLWDAAANLLQQVLEEDIRKETGTQDYIEDAPLHIICVADTTKITGKTPQGIIETIYADTGFISQNIYLYATSAGMGSVIRALVPKE
ncbi:MAG: nitroreductase family protein, partial [Bacteroidales bacterium]|nr:nitroreductase family protein [Bacteroidales bacterium]